MILFHQDHLLGAAILTGGHPVIVEATGDRTVIIVIPLPDDAVFAGSFSFVHKGFHQLALQVIDVYSKD